MMNAVTSRLVCLVYPIGATLQRLLEGGGSLSIIAAEQYIAMQREIKELEVMLYDEEMSIGAHDILMVMTCLPLVPEAILRKFDKVVYFFDDLNTWKWMYDKAYSDRMRHVDVIIHPLKSVADHLARHLSKPTFHVPWTISRLPKTIPERSKQLSFFLDMDNREVYLQSIDLGADFIRAVEPMQAKIFVPENVHTGLPVDLRSLVSPVAAMQHGDFLCFLGQIWFYVSGIPGSYEYSVLESAYLGCGLVSLNSAIHKDHCARNSFIDYDGKFDIVRKLRLLAVNFDPDLIRNDARRLYPADAPSFIPNILETAFSSRQ